MYREEAKLIPCDSQIQTSSPQSLLSDSIIAYMDQYANREDEDMIRQFFRHQVSQSSPAVQPTRVFPVVKVQS